MRPKQYPLDALIKVRQSRLDVAVNGLAAALRETQEARRLREAAEQQRERDRDAATATRSREAAAMARGELSAADAQRLSAWEAREAWEDAEKVRRIATLKDAEVSAERRETAARGLVGEAEAELKVASEAKRRWIAESERQLEAAAEENATEAWRPPR
jgi:hypothetical protein